MLLLFGPIVQREGEGREKGGKGVPPLRPFGKEGKTKRGGKKKKEKGEVFVVFFCPLLLCSNHLALHWGGAAKMFKGYIRRRKEGQKEPQTLHT